MTKEKAHLEGGNSIVSNAWVLEPECFFCFHPPSPHGCVVGASYLTLVSPFPHPYKGDKNDVYGCNDGSSLFDRHLATTWMLRWSSTCRGEEKWEVEQD